MLVLCSIAAVCFSGLALLANGDHKLDRVVQGVCTVMVCISTGLFSAYALIMPI